MPGQVSFHTDSLDTNRGRLVTFVGTFDGPTPATHLTPDPTEFPMPRNRLSAKKAGSSFERTIADYLKVELGDDRIDRRVKHGSKDRGDIGGVRTIQGGRVVVECKNVASLNLSGWLNEAEAERGNDDAVIAVVVHKRVRKSDPAEQYVTMTAKAFAILLGAQA